MFDFQDSTVVFFITSNDYKNQFLFGLLIFYCVNNNKN